jgi:hypothetical protein
MYVKATHGIFESNEKNMLICVQVAKPAVAPTDSAITRLSVKHAAAAPSHAQQELSA